MARLLLLALFPGLAAAQPQPPEPDPTAAQRVEITGSLLMDANGRARPVTVIQAADLARAGVTTAEQALRRIAANQPQQNLSSAVGEITGGVSEADLRGLGAEKTLVLLNGRRVSTHAYDPGTVDLNALPMSAIERIEVLRDGASAVYGSGAVSGVVNFVLRRDVVGLELLAEGEAPRGAGGDVARVSALAGWAGEGFSAFATVDHRRQRAIAGTDRPFSRSGVLRRPDGSEQFLTSGTSFPGDLDGFEPSLAAGCAPPRSIPDPERRSCRYDFVGDIDLIPHNEQTTLLAQASFDAGAGASATLEFLRAENRTQATQTPTPAQMFLPDSSPYWIAGRPSRPVAGFGSGGVVDWLIEPAGRRRNDTRSVAQRLLAGVEGRAGGFQYDAALLRSTSSVADRLASGYLSGAAVQQGLIDGRINPFGAPDAAGQAALDAAQLRGTLLKASGQATTLEARAGTELATLPGGPLFLWLGLEAGRERFGYDPQPLAADNAAPELEFAVDTQGSRRRGALRAELQLPLSADFKLDLAVRHDRYSDSGGQWSPKLGMAWQADRALLLRGSVGRGFRVPTLYEVHQPLQLARTSDAYDDPLLCPDGEAVDGALPGVVCNQQVLRRFGGPTGYGRPASALKPETSHSASVGFVLEASPRAVLSADLWDLRLRDEIDERSEETIFDDPARHASRIVRCSQLTPVQRAGIGACLHYPAFDPIAFVDTPVENLGDIKTSGIDLSLALRSGTGAFGELLFSVDATYVGRYAFRGEPDGPYVGTVGRYADDLPIFRWQHVAQIEWRFGDWSAALSQRYKSGYADQEPGNRVAAYSLFDLAGSYAGVPGLALSAGVKNLFDRSPPYSNQDETLQRNFDPRFTDPTGRAWFLRASYRFP